MDYYFEDYFNYWNLLNNYFYIIILIKLFNLIFYLLTQKSCTLKVLEFIVHFYIILIIYCTYYNFVLYLFIKWVLENIYIHAKFLLFNCRSLQCINIEVECYLIQKNLEHTLFSDMNNWTAGFANCGTISTSRMSNLAMFHFQYINERRITLEEKRQVRYHNWYIYFAFHDCVIVALLFC